MKNLLKPDGRVRGRWLVALGAGLLVFALLMLLRVPGLAQYMAEAPAEAAGTDEDGKSAESALMGVVKAWEAQRAELGTGVKAGLSATAYNGAIESSAGQTDSATLTCVSDGWFDAHPKFLKDGRLFSATELADGAKVVVLDEQLAFKLFPTTEPTEGKALIGDAWYEVIGVVRHARQAGDADAYGAYIPIVTAAKAGLQTKFLEIDCALTVSGAARAVETVGASVLGADGTFCDTSKEVMRATMIMRALCVLFALYALARLLRAWNARTRALIAGWREEVLHRYFKAMLPAVILRSLGQILGYAVLAAGAYGVLTLTIRPMYVFTEWIPEVIVEWSKISARALELLTSAAAPIKFQTREYAAIRFYGALVRWGVVCLLSGFLLVRMRGRSEKRAGVVPGRGAEAD